MLTKARSIEAEKSIPATAHAVTIKSASTTETGVTNQTSELTRQMNELITIVKNQQVQNAKGGNRNGSNRFNAQDKFKDNNKGGRNLKGQTKMLQVHLGMELHHSSDITAVDGDIEPLNVLCL